MMEITLETIYQQQLDDKVELKAVEQGLHRLEIEVAREIAGVKQAVADSQARIIQWVVSLFIGSMVTLATLGGIYISVLLAR